MVLCWCGRECVIRTSWTTRNPGRRFYSCPVKGSSCKFVAWFDNAMCSRSALIIPTLVTKKKALEDKLLESERLVWKLKIALIVSWMVFFVYMFRF